MTENRSARKTLDVEQLAGQVLDGSRSALSRAITLVESTRADHRQQAQQLLVRLGAPGAAGPSGAAVRLGVTGVPGVGKSTFVDELGSRLTASGHRVAVLAVDPSSTRTGGSILGDKTRMARLATDENAFVRPSPTSGTLGGVARATREAMIVVEAAGYDTVIVETVGVGQSETTVADMVDTFLLLSLARSGDQLQGIKKGVLELADVIAVNKADGAHAAEAGRAARELAGALRLLGTSAGSWRPPVLTCSACEGTGMDDVWAAVLRHRAAMGSSGALVRRRQAQQVEWTRAMVRDGLLARLRTDAAVRRSRELEARVLAGDLTPVQAAEQALRDLI